MKIWLPDSLYRLKPFLLGFAGTVFLYVSEDMFTTVLALLCMGYAFWIIVMRLLWSSAVTIQARGGSIRAGKYKKHIVKSPDK